MRTMKKGRFGKYKNKLYELYESIDGKYELVSNDPRDIQNGFVEKYPSTYVKTVDKTEITEAFRILPFGEYKGSKFDVSANVKEGMYNLGTTDAALAEKLGFNRTDKYYYEKWVPKGEVKVIEEKKQIKL